MTKKSSADVPDKPDVVLDDGDTGGDDIDDEPDVADVGDTALIAIEKRDDISVTVIRPPPGPPSGNTRRRIEDYMEMKKAARELHDLEDFDLEH